MKTESCLPLVELTRGDLPESLHIGVIAVVDSSEKLVASVGDTQQVTYLRSTAKPFQALPFLEAGGQEYFHLTEKEVAVICASHSGMDGHVKTIQGIFEKVGIGEGDLMCGAHPAYHEETAKRMLLAGEDPTPLRHNCSGKHTGMLAFAKMLGAPLESYLEQDHPVQRQILATFAEMCSLPVDEIYLGIDGCSAPNYAVSMYHAALSWARLVDPTGLPEKRAAACSTITKAMTAYPDMIAGPDRLDTALMEAAGDRVVSKAGAEGYQGLGIFPGVFKSDSPGLGIAIKIADGDRRGLIRPMVSIEVLRQLGVLAEADLEELGRYGPAANIENWRKLVVGKMYPVFDLNYK